MPYDPQEGTKIWFESLNHTAKTNLVVVQTRVAEGFGGGEGRIVVQEGRWRLGAEGTSDKRHAAGRPGPFLPLVANWPKQPLNRYTPGDNA